MTQIRYKYRESGTWRNKVSDLNVLLGGRIMMTVPQFSKGDRVRVMQTDTMVRQGFANKQGDVVSVSNLHNNPPLQQVVVSLDGVWSTSLFSNDSLMKVTKNDG